MDDIFAAADTFLLNHARLLERRLFAACFLGQPATHVIDALRGYQNDDGGFGHALEPDKRWWRGVVTLAALRTLTSYGRIAPRV
jgi:hypothetical protein